MCNHPELAENFFLEEKIAEEESGILHFDKNINNFCHIKTINNVNYVNILEPNILNSRDISQHNYIQITQQYIVNKIILHDIPNSYFTLSLNGHNVATFKKIMNTNDYVIDIFKCTNELFNTIKNSLSYPQNLDIKRSEYLNLTKIDNVRISYPKDTIFNNKYISYTLYGYKYNLITDTFDYINTKYKYYINTVNLYFKHPTNFINFNIEVIDKNTNGNLYFYIDGIMIKNIRIEPNDTYKRINFDNINHIIKRPYGIENDYITDDMLKQTLNLSCINHIQFALSNVKLYNISQFYFNIYQLPEMISKFDK